jgi:hypothetical protein
MNKLAILGFILFTQSSWAALASPQSLQFTTIETNATLTESELARACSKSEVDASEKLRTVSAILAEPAGALRVSGGYGWTQNTPVFPTQPQGNNIFYCILTLSSSDSLVTFKKSMPVSLSHLSRADWDTACKPAFDTASANPLSVVTLYSESWTAFQGRMCDVSTVEVVRI